MPGTRSGALIIEDAGFRAVADYQALELQQRCGYPDGQRVPT